MCSQDAAPRDRDPEHSERVQPVAADPGASRLPERLARARSARAAEHPPAERQQHRSGVRALLYALFVRVQYERSCAVLYASDLSIRFV